MAFLEEAFGRMIDAQERVTGSRDTVRINGTEHDSLCHEITANDVMLAGGRGERGGFICNVAVSEFSGPPAKFDPIEKVDEGMALVVLSVDTVNGIVYRITAGDPLVE